jgi:hypothetical protein
MGIIGSYVDITSGAPTHQAQIAVRLDIADHVVDYF